MKKRSIFALMMLPLVLSCASCGSAGSSAGGNPVVTMEIEDYGTIEIELYPDIAPITVANFVSLVSSGFYDNNNFHRLSTEFVLQGGDPTGTGRGGPGYCIKGEFSYNGVQNDLKHTAGVISMARMSNPYTDSAGSQFFIMLGDSDFLDGQYAAFGKVIKGFENIQNLAAQYPSPKFGTEYSISIKIIKATVELNGYKVPAFEKLPEI
ncbi:MAG: peptidylprolyl isomerase [Clostridia bacterium]|nr:peptidylprolyl isomerase [Clostridia bacterium]